MVQSAQDRAAGDLPRPLNAASSCPCQSSLWADARDAARPSPNRTSLAQTCSSDDAFRGQARE